MAEFYEFFAGGGMVRHGLGPGWTCRFANDFDPKKAAAYRDNYGDGELKLGDVSDVRAKDLPGTADLAWASFPCQDLSLAGAGAGLAGGRSGTFYPFWNVMRALIATGRAPRMIALENVCGALTSHGGKDFEIICRTYAEAGYRAGALVINADLFTPQSRPRLFVIGAHRDIEIPTDLLGSGPVAPYHPPALQTAVGRLPAELKAQALWWRLSTPQPRTLTFKDMIEDPPTGVAWHSHDETLRLLSLMSPLHAQKLEAAKASGRLEVGCLYRRTRPGADGVKVQRAEVRFDDVSGCLRTPAGGSSRQTLLIVEGARVRSRLISARETARLMGLDDGYRLPANYNDAYHLTGDGVVAPVVRHLARHIFEPIIRRPQPLRAVA